MLKRRIINPAALTLLVCLIAATFFVPVPWYAFVILVLSWFLITLCGSFLIRWDYHFKSLHANKNIEQDLVSITFDDGPNPEFTPKILALLKRYNAKATFFCIGQRVEKYPNILREIVADGHSVGNHTHSHSKSFGFFGQEQVISELEKANTVIKKVTGLDTRLYRPCFAVTNPKIEKAVKKLNLHSIGWNVRSLDTTPRPEKMVLKRITSKISRGDIVLLHDTSEKTVTVLEQLLLFLKEKKLRSVPVDQLLKIQAYVQ